MALKIVQHRNRLTPIEWAGPGCYKLAPSGRLVKQSTTTGHYFSSAKDPETDHQKTILRKSSRGG